MIFGIAVTYFRQHDQWSNTVDIVTGSAWVEAINYDEAFGIASRFAKRLTPPGDGWRFQIMVSSVEIDPKRIDTYTSLIPDKKAIT